MAVVDYTKFSTQGPEAASPANRRWWLLKTDDIPTSVTSIISFLKDHQGDRNSQIINSAKLYGNVSLMGLSGVSYSQISSIQRGVKDRITYNVVQSAIDTVTSKIAKNKPKPLFLTSGGDYRQQRRAKKLDKFVDGIFYENDAYPQGTMVFRDACVWGTGLTHVYASYGRVKHERVCMSELFVDEVEALYGNPRQLHRVKAVDRDVLLELFPDKASKIRDALVAAPDNVGGLPNISDSICVRESWHLPSGPEAGDGLHVITIAGATLLTEKWTRDHFPFAFFHWNKRLFGFWGQGLAEQIQNIQLEINKLLWVIQRSMHLAGSFKVLLENGSKIVKEHVNNDIGAMICYSGTPPQYITPPIVPPEIYQHLVTLKNAAFEQAGVSQLSASSKKPDGLNSGKALREYNDIETERFMTVGQAYEQYFLDLAKLDIETAKEIFSEDKSYSVKVPDTSSIEDIDWKEIELDEDDYVMKAYPVSSLPDDPSGRLQTIQEYMQAGLLDPRTGRKLLEFPDLEAEENLSNAMENRISQIFDGILDADVEDVEEAYQPPEPYYDLNLCREMCLEYIVYSELNGVEEEKIDLFRRFLDQVGVLQVKAQPPAPAMPGAPQGVPAAPPVSDMLNNVPQQAA